MNPNIATRPITAQETYALRGTILRPNQPKKDLVFTGDTAGDTFHAGAFSDDKLIGVASAFHENPPFDPTINGWRLRGMAVVEKLRGMGYGRALLRTCMKFITEQGGVVVWCNSRTYAIPFYISMGFAVHGDEFDIPTIGPHYVMWRHV
ncbi:GNAT family N-acetyltransferase [Chloroflexota bacterium]